GLKRHILTDNCIDKDMDDVQLYLVGTSSSLLRGHLSIRGILCDRDTIEVRVKYRISSSMARINRTRSSSIECLNIMKLAKTMAPQVEPQPSPPGSDHQSDQWLRVCPEPGCGYRTASKQDFNHHKLIHRARCQLCFYTFKSIHRLNKHHLRSHPNDFPTIPWITCPHNGCRRMASNPMTVLVSVKTLRSEVEDYWFPLPPTLKTIDCLKRQILSNDCIDKDMDDVQLYLCDGLLRGHSSIGDVLINRDCIELRAKRRISSLPNTTVGHQMKAEPALECITVEDSDDETMGDTSGVQTIVKTERISGNQEVQRRPLTTSVVAVMATAPAQDYRVGNECPPLNGGHELILELEEWIQCQTMAIEKRMASNPMTVLVSVKTLRSEVEDYWQPLPPTLKTIDCLKRQILSNDCIDKDMDDVELYLSDGLLRGHSSIGDVLINRDRIELRAKRRINSLPDSTGGHKLKAEPALECITVEDSDDETMADTSGVQTIVKTESISGNQLNGNDKPSIVSFTSVANHLEISSPPKVVNSSVVSTSGYNKCKSVVNECVTIEDSDDESMSVRSGVQTVVKIGNQLNALPESGNKWATIFNWDPIVSESQANSDAPKVITKSEAKRKPEAKTVDKSMNVSKDRVITDTTASMSSAAVVSTSVATKTMRPKATGHLRRAPGSGRRSGGRKLRGIRCRRPGCNYESFNVTDLRNHECGRYLKWQLCGGKARLSAHHIRSRADHSAATQWSDCPMNICLFKIKDVAHN
ncbi:unnamed protein product, partial [Medioppia subpectinata]